MFDYLCSGTTQKSVVVAVSPLKALVLDQVRAFTAKGLSCAYVVAPDDIFGSTQRPFLLCDQFRHSGLL